RRRHTRSDRDWSSDVCSSDLARALGAPDRRLIARHILPNTLPPLIVQATTSFPVAILAEAGLAYLGLGTQPPNPSWGLMLREARSEERRVGKEGRSRGEREEC